MIHEIIDKMTLFSLSPWADITVVTENESGKEEGCNNNVNKNSQVHYYNILGIYLDHHNVYGVGIAQLV
jgi:hypothetical protein